MEKNLQFEETLRIKHQLGNDERQGSPFENLNDNGGRGGNVPQRGQINEFQDRNNSSNNSGYNRNVETDKTLDTDIGELVDRFIKNNPVGDVINLDIDILNCIDKSEEFDISQIV